MGYVHQFGVILADPGAKKGPKICQKLSKKRGKCVSQLLNQKELQFFDKYVLSK